MIKKILSWLVFVLLFALIILGFATKDKLNQFLSKSIINNTPHELINTSNKLVDSLFNYSNNQLNYEITFLEFGAKGCSACQKMELVMEEIRNEYPQKINVVFLNILHPENQMLMKYYGIAAIPTQILLDKNSNEFFRHTGFISALELEKEFNK